MPLYYVEMLQRWIIRSMFMLPILFCVGGWGWNGIHSGWVSYSSHNGDWIECATRAGLVGVGWGSHIKMNVYNEGWRCVVKDATGDRFWPRDTPERHFFLGFDFHHYVDAGDQKSFLYAPYWFFILGFSVILYFVWQKTRPKPNPRKAFPVEVGKASGSS